MQYPEVIRKELNREMGLELSLLFQEGDSHPWRVLYRDTDVNEPIGIRKRKEENQAVQYFDEIFSSWK